MSASVYPMRSQMGSRIVQLCHDSTYGYAHSLFNTVNNPSSLFSTPFPYATKTNDVFPKFRGASRFSQHIIKDFWLNCYSTFSFSRYLNLTFKFIFALIILYWFSVNVKPWLQRHFTFDMLLHIGHWLLWWVAVTMYGRFHPQLLNVIRH